MSSTNTSASTHAQASSTLGYSISSSDESSVSRSGASTGSARNKRKFDHYQTRGGQHDSGFASEAEDQGDAAEAQGVGKRHN
ncbi:hypothetical protein L486_02999 [Kwoniella mangroviensis CBS 10435]|uniref:Uncharacterized protein n=1 Tax=Kwoniella mangroviensis CBS 10435 TaxID=1331196 RepID=A0A1B9IXS3_9TREE|nr:hypothetical protein L486_02999 [Kwoniella mangroviensis CBS 10435]OCF72484.1 hypothetical protein I204_06864 [Kwoniella mangroviensis CBS 8886]